MSDIEKGLVHLQKVLNDINIILGGLLKELREKEESTKETIITKEFLLDLVISTPGSTANELALMVGADREKLRKTLYSLLHAKKIVNSGKKICEITNHEAYCWWPK